VLFKLLNFRRLFHHEDTFLYIKCQMAKIRSNIWNCYLDMLLLILATPVLVIMVYPGRKLYTLFVHCQVHNEKLYTLSECTECAMKSSSTVRWKAATQHSAASVLDPWCINLQNEVVDFGSVSLSLCWKLTVDSDIHMICLSLFSTHIHIAKIFHFPGHQLRMLNSMVRFIHVLHKHFLHMLHYLPLLVHHWSSRHLPAKC
jgi:hypothetical protein